MSDRPNHITPAGYRALRKEYEALFGVERPQLVETISWAAGNGDRSENGDYIYGRKRLREVDRRIAWTSPIGRAIRGAAVGDVRRVTLPGGERELEISRIDYPDAAVLNRGEPIGCPRGGGGTGDSQ
jgi:transcription elongation GreA/GreB family factor